MKGCGGLRDDTEGHTRQLEAVQGYGRPQMITRGHGIPMWTPLGAMQNHGMWTAPNPMPGTAIENIRPWLKFQLNLTQDKKHDFLACLVGRRWTHFSIYLANRNAAIPANDHSTQDVFWDLSSFWSLLRDVSALIPRHSNQSVSHLSN